MQNAGTFTEPTFRLFVPLQFLGHFNYYAFHVVPFAPFVFMDCGSWCFLTRLPALYGAYSVVANIIPLFTPSDIKAITRCAKQCLAGLFKPRP